MDICGVVDEMCDGIGNCVLKDGFSCMLFGDCESGFCVDGVCCEIECNVMCAVCVVVKIGGVDGVCYLVFYGIDFNGDCLVNESCDFVGACSFNNGELCMMFK